MRRLTLSVIAGLCVALISTSVAYASGLTESEADKSVTAWQEAAQKTKAYTQHKILKRNTAPRRSGPVAPDSGLTEVEIGKMVQAEIDASSPCAYFFGRGQYCTYQLTDQPADPKKAPDPGRPGQETYVVQLTSAQAAQIAVAQLKLPAVKPGIGPDPSINRWKMAAVGYPLWLWADGPTEVGPVSQTVANLRVSLQARLTSVTYDMGDGHQVSCAGPGTRWTRAVTPGQPSRCGYRYQRPSLPAGDYTVTATSHWDITWVIGNQSGVITMDQQGTRTLPVGELQALVR